MVMSKSLRVIFDGEVLRPEGKAGLQPNVRYRVTVEEEEAAPATDDEAAYPLTALLDLAADMGVEDLAARHDSYAHRRLENNGDRTE